MIEYIKNILSAKYDLHAVKIKNTQGGWSAAAFIAYTDKSAYFLKIYDKQRPSIRQWIDRMALYMPVALWLSENTPLKNSMIIPVLTKDGEYQSENEQYVMLAFPYISGETLGATRLSAPQIRQLADILILLHSYREDDLPVAASALKESYTLPFITGLTDILSQPHGPASLQNLLNRHSNKIVEKVDILKNLAEQLRHNPPRGFLCHTDLHGWNLMWNGNLILIDWEGLSLAPVEADLFSFTDGFFFDYAKEHFFQAYKKAMTGYSINENALTFYRLRRRLEDISEFACSLAHDYLSATETSQSLSALQKECAAL